MWSLHTQKTHILYLWQSLTCEWYNVCMIRKFLWNIVLFYFNQLNGTKQKKQKSQLQKSQPMLTLFWFWRVYPKKKKGIDNDRYAMGFWRHAEHRFFRLDFGQIYMTPFLSNIQGERVLFGFFLKKIYIFSNKITFFHF